MCYTLSAEKVILNYFAKSGKERITFAELNKLSSKIVRACNNGVIVALNREAIENAIKNRSDIISINNDTIFLIDRNNSIIKNSAIINRTIPEVISNKCLDLWATI